MFKKILKFLRAHLEHPKLNPTNLSIEGTFATMQEEDVARRERNQIAIAEANLRLQQDAYQKNLMVLHRTMLIALAAVLVAIIVGLFSILSKPKIIVQPAPVTIVAPRQ